MKRWKIVYETYCKAVEQIYASVQSYLPYVPVCDREQDERFNIVYVGLDSSMEGFRIHVTEADGEHQSIEITACDEVNLLYAASDFRNIYLPYAKYKNGDNVVDFYHNDLFTGALRPYDYTTKPHIRHRGLWTWGHTIYDYQKYIDHMVTLKMNTLIIWNDFVPVNINQIISYAHENGVQIYLGFAWGWDTDCAGTNIADTAELTKTIVQKYQKEYQSLACDGIYFQSFTELNREDIGGVNIAAAVTDFVNNTAEVLYQINPDLQLLFGLHANSVINKLEVFKAIDPRIAIIWENLGAFPYHNFSDRLENFAETADLTRRIQSLRKGGFGTVLKSNYRLDWGSFEHQQGPYIMGVCDENYVKTKAEEKKPLLKKIQADWIKNAGFAHELIREFDSSSIITVLAEDGVFEEIISYPLALYAQMMWDCGRNTDEIMHITAQMPDVTFV